MFCNLFLIIWFIIESVIYRQIHRLCCIFFYEVLRCIFFLMKCWVIYGVTVFVLTIIIYCLLYPYISSTSLYKILYVLFVSLSIEYRWIKKGSLEYRGASYKQANNVTAPKKCLANFTYIHMR